VLFLGFHIIWISSLVMSLMIVKRNKLEKDMPDNYENLSDFVL
jgi:hypothetical protein